MSKQSRNEGYIGGISRKIGKGPGLSGIFESGLTCKLQGIPVEVMGFIINLEMRIPN